MSPSPSLQEALDRASRAMQASAEVLEETYDDIDLASLPMASGGVCYSGCGQVLKVTLGWGPFGAEQHGILPHWVSRTTAPCTFEGEVEAEHDGWCWVCFTDPAENDLGTCAWCLDQLRDETRVAPPPKSTVPAPEGPTRWDWDELEAIQAARAIQHRFYWTHWIVGQNQSYLEVGRAETLDGPDWWTRNGINLVMLEHDDLP